jgi:uroporphyrinogen-III synthase
VLVFTSPLNATAYFARHAPQPGQHTVAIGQPTAAALEACGLARVAVAAAPTEAELARAVLGFQA